MQKVFSQVYSQFLEHNYDELVAARERADAINTVDMTLGDGIRAEILAATGAQSIDELIENAKVIKRIKRGALIQVHGLLYYSNKYGLMQCTVPSAFGFSPLKWVEGPSLMFAGSKEILERLGVKTQRQPDGEYIHDYSECVESQANWV